MSEINFKDKQDYIDYLTGRSRFADGGQVAPTEPSQSVSTPVNPTPAANPVGAQAAIPSPNPSVTQAPQQQPGGWMASQGTSPTPQQEQPGFKLPTTPNPGNATWDYHQGQWIQN